MRAISRVASGSCLVGERSDTCSPSRRKVRATVEFPTDRGGRGLGGSGRWGGQFLVGDRGFQATVAVATDPVVAVDPSCDSVASAGPGGEHGPVDDLGLEGGEKRFGHGVVQA